MMRFSYNMKNKYDPTIRVVTSTKKRDDVFFRIAGDKFLEVTYGGKETPMNLDKMLLSIFRVITVNEKVRSMNIEGLIETVPGGRTILYKFDPVKINLNSLIEAIIAVENEVQSIEDIEFETRVINLPLVFDDNEVRKAIEKYTRDIKPDAVNCENGSNLQYIARYNGISLEEFKQKFLKTEWLVAMIGFYPGLPFCYPLDPLCAVTAPKYNPPRTWMAAGTVDLADYCSTICSIDSAGGYQLVGRTAPIFQPSQKHHMFKDNPILFKTKDIIKYYEVSQEELQKIYDIIENGGNWEYKILQKKFSLQEWLLFCNKVSNEAKDFKKKQEHAKKITPIP